MSTDAQIPNEMLANNLKIHKKKYIPWPGGIYPRVTAVYKNELM